MPIGDEIRFDEPENQCFGCSQHNQHAFGLTFTHVAPSTVETRYTAPDHVCGAPGIVHGGVQAVLLDEAVGFAVHVHEEARDGLTYYTRAPVVTVEFDLRYRRPVLTGVEVILRAEVVRAAGTDFLTVGEILDDTRQVLTSALARWRRLD